jgi:hypothetical protein
MSTPTWLHSPREALCGLSLALMTLLASLAFLSGCGPGVGGSGTGATADPLAASGASAASVCSGELAALLSCPPGTASAPSPAGSSVVTLADTIDGKRVQVRLQGDLIEIDSPCAQLQFRGQWGSVGGQPGRYFGFTSPDATPTPASAAAQLSGSGVLLTVRDAAGRVLLGPVQLNVVASLATAGGCN